MDSLRITVIWSPDDPVGLPLADVIARHFDNAEEARAFGGIRIPVFVRYAAFSPGSAAPRPIDLEAAEHNLLVAVGTHFLVERLADDQAWANWFDDLGKGVKRRGNADRFVLVCLESTVRSLAAFPGIQSIRTDEWDSEAGTDAFNTRLLLLLTNRCGALLLEAAKPPDKLSRTPKQRLFISHAKLDGADDAVRIRRRLDETDFGIEPFVDANDLNAGEAFTEELEAEIADATLLAVQTDAYSSRPFCRWEILRAKFHRRPIYIVHRLKQGETRVFPYGGNAPLLVVNDLSNATIDRILLAAMTIVLRGMVWARLADAAIERKKLTDKVVTLARTPELVDLAHIKMRKANPLPQLIVYPDPVLSDEERELIPALELGIEVMSLSELEAQP
ncbi:MAG TPA: toll/interleukin-1 receptor domain-containing protein [Xanthobacteraceae bacterium]|nr:toll/interleukin-1 receptor domain-containing protein [Xanthobacteraceae bacterium]